MSASHPSPMNSIVEWWRLQRFLEQRRHPPSRVKNARSDVTATGTGREARTALVVAIGKLHAAPAGATASEAHVQL